MSAWNSNEDEATEKEVCSSLRVERGPRTHCKLEDTNLESALEGATETNSPLFFSYVLLFALPQNRKMETHKDTPGHVPIAFTCR